MSMGVRAMVRGLRPGTDAAMAVSALWRDAMFTTFTNELVAFGFRNRQRTAEKWRVPGIFSDDSDTATG